ncbi:antirepressor [Siminovitchia terrae]|uniref:Rha family transcriptional regulator n=1 Tax=Siminovitchia terrae TaxID=1914933 RepID=UPI001B13DCA8|nr:Rha family transcriptional regulator [Siminovitchia terrae]GIN93370.1 antirepressor [Siminovitchia terrae]
MNQLVFIENNQPVTDSLTIAEMFGKRHDHVLRDIKNQIELAGEKFAAPNFGESTYQDKNQQLRPKFNLTEEAFTLVVFSYNTKESVQTKIKFIQEFKKMREKLNKPMSIEDMIITQAQSVKELKLEVSEIKKVVDNEVWLTERQKKTVQDSVSRRVFELRRKGHDAHFQTLYSSLKRFFGVSKYDKIPRKDFDEAVSFIAGWYPPVKQQYAESE